MTTKFFSDRTKYLAVKAGILHVILLYIIALFFSKGIVGSEVIPFFDWSLFTNTAKLHQSSGIKVYEIDGQKVEPFYLHDPNHSYDIHASVAMDKLIYKMMFRCFDFNKKIYFENLPPEKKKECLYNDKVVLENVFKQYDDVSYQLILRSFDVMERYAMDRNERYRPEAFLTEDILFDTKMKKEEK